MNDILGSYAILAASQSRAAQWTVRAGTAFALEKRSVDAEHALIEMEGHTRTQLINALRSSGQHLRP